MTFSSGPNANDMKQPVYLGFERDVLRTVADYYQRLKEPLLTFHLYEVFVNILSECFILGDPPQYLDSAASLILLLSAFSLRDLHSISHLLIAGLLQEQDVATEALQVSCLLLPPPNRRRLQLLLRLMARVCQNPQLPPLNDTIATRTLVLLFLTVYSQYRLVSILFPVCV